MISIRRADEGDIDFILEQLKNFAEFLETKHSVFGDELYARKGVELLIHDHVFLIAELNGVRAGFISGFFNTHFFNPSITVLCELFWYVLPKYRRTRIGALLFSEYEKIGREKAKWITMSLNRKTPVKEASLIKRGYQKHEIVYLKEN